MPKEIHFRKAISQNDKLIIRDYIPPNFYARFRAIADRAAEVRAEKSDIKTQIRWGNADLEIFTKAKGEKEQFRRQNLREFMGEADLPKFDMDVKWENRETKFRRKLEFNEKTTGLPSMGNQSRQSLVRQRSLQNDREQIKKHRKNDISQEGVEDAMDELDSPQASRNSLSEDI